MPDPMTVDGYIEAAPSAAQPLLLELRRLIRTAVPDAAERMRYGMPAYDYAGRRLVHLAAATHHVAVYGLVHVDAGVAAQLAPYLTHRSTLRFRLGQPLPTAALTKAIHQKAQDLDDAL